MPLPSVSFGGSATVDEGEYPADLLRVEDNGKSTFGPTLRWVFNVIVEGDTETLDMLTGVQYSKKSKLKQVVDALLGHSLDPKVDEPPDLEALVGQPCRVEVVINDNGYSSIAAVKASQRKRATAAA